MIGSIDPSILLRLVPDKLAQRCNREEHPKRAVRQRPKSMAQVELRSTLDRFWISAIENVEQRQCYTDGAFGLGNPPKAVDQEVSTKPLALDRAIHPDHRDEDGRYLPVVRPSFCEPLGQILIIDSRGILGVESQHLPVAAIQNKSSEIRGTSELVRGQPEKIINLDYSAVEGRSIVSSDIQRLGDGTIHSGCGRLLGLVAFAILRKGLAQGFCRWRGIFQRLEHGRRVFSSQLYPFLGFKDLERRFVSRVHRERGIINAGNCRGILNSFLYPRLCPEAHPLRRTLLDLRRNIHKLVHHRSLKPVLDDMYAELAHKATRSAASPPATFRWKTALAAVLTVCAIGFASAANASPCPAGAVFNPITKVRWTCIFPITIGGVRIGTFDKLSKELDAQSSTKPLCACRKGATFWFGVKVSFWSPNRMIDVVTEPGCMMALGADLMPAHGKLQGSQSSIADGTNTRKMFAQMHYYISPVWAMLDMFTDLPCLEDNGFDVALITEVLPTWQSGTLGAIIQPEGILFGNPAAGLACMADSAAAAAGKVIDPLFWCMGSWGATYPIAGDIHFDDSVEAWAGLAARGTFMMGRLGAATISSGDGCSFKAAPIWTKSRYKYQLMEPVKGGSCVNVGRPGALWSSAKHAPAKDNAQFMVFEKVICCAGISVP